jgi:two-component system, chemotaxis family, sensor kinase Cph1
MKIRDIVNRDIVNLTNCEQEPIHIPGSIQPHGFLLGLKGDNLHIEYCSANTAEYLTLFHTELLGKDFAVVFGTENAEKLVAYMLNRAVAGSALLRLTLNGVNFVCTVHTNNEGICILEGEPIAMNRSTSEEEYDQTSLLLRYMHDTHTLKELCQLVTEGTREITGYDRVMVYRFDKDYNGEVFAESCREDLEPFLGLHYPHTDIPPQARELYMKNLLRLLSDIDYTPVPVYTQDDGTDKNLDMSLSILRSTSPIHVQYLNNMGVGATLTISLIYQNKLWGLIACHHYAPKNLSPEIRRAAQLQGHFITSQIDVRQASEEYELSRRTTLSLEKMNNISLQQDDDMKKIADNPELLSVCNASGVSILYNGVIYSSGTVPEEKDILLLANYFAVNAKHGNFTTDKLSNYFDAFKTLGGKVSGIIYHALGVNNNDCIIWYRPESKTQVNWAGDPSKSILKNEKGLSPRRSFALWKEIVDSTSRPWLRPELESAGAYAFSLQKQINILLISREEEKYRKLSELLKETNSELENINWISTHDLQEPLRKIQLIASHILSRGHSLPETVENAIGRMNISANRMQTLLVDILKYTRLKHTNNELVAINLINLLDEVKLDMAEAIAEKDAEIITAPLPEINGVGFLLKQLFVNLISNSIKYAHPERNPVITISAAEAPQNYNGIADEFYNVLYVSDNGIGFDQKYAEQAFNIFTRLHNLPDHKGSGVGLALCKKIMQNHNGYIVASSTVNEGTTITLYFPL